MRIKIFLYAFFTSLLAVIIFGVMMQFIVRRSLIEESREAAKIVASTVVNDIDKDYIEREDGQDISFILPENSNFQITLLDEDGNVVGDNHTQIISDEDFVNSPEVLEAVSDGDGEDIHQFLKEDALVQYATYDTESGYIVHVMVRVLGIKQVNSGLIVAGIIGLLASAGLALLVAIFFGRGLSKKLNRFVNAIRAYASGQGSDKELVETKTDLDILADEFLEMRKSFDTLIGDTRRRNVEFDTVLSSMADGLIALNLDLKIMYINPVAKEIFSIRKTIEDNVTFLQDIVYQRLLLKAVNRCLNHDESQVIQLKIGQDEILDYRITISPMHRRGRLFGAIILLTDITHMLELEQLRTDFVANVSHELRTPLTSIKGYTEALKDSSMAQDGYEKRFLEIIEIESDRLSSLINDLMELSKIENGSEDINIGEHRLITIVDDIIELVAMKAKKKHVAIRRDIAENLIIVANKDRIKQLVLNLIDNGIKYNRDYGTLDIKASYKGTMLTMAFIDSGEGIAEKDIPRLFERFYRVEKSRSRELGGTGLGLSIVKHIADLYQGSVSIESGKGQGTTFIVRMPIVKQ